MSDEEEKIEVTLYSDYANTVFILIIFDRYYRAYRFTDPQDIAQIDLTYGGSLDPDYVPEYIKENEEDEGIKKCWRIEVPNLNYIYNIVSDWKRKGEFDYYDYYGNRPWYGGIV